MSLPNFYNENTGRAYPLVAFSNALLAVAVPPLTTQIAGWNATNVSVTPGQWQQVLTGGWNNGGYWLSLSPSTGGAGSVTWQFPVVPGRQYRIAATWLGDPDHATNARFTVTETEGPGLGYFELLAVLVDQRASPTQHIAYGSGWLDLSADVFQPTRRILLVAVNDDSDMPAVADAIWVEDVTPLADPIVPFQPPPDTLIDFGCMVGLDAEFDSGAHVVYLHQIIRAGNTFTFDFRSNAPGLLEYSLLFNRDLAAVEYATDYVAATLIDGSGSPQDTLWEGFLVTGPMDSLAVLLPTDGAITPTTGPQIEPALIQNLGRGYVRTINLANQDRTRAVPPPPCPGSDDPGTDYSNYIVNARNLVGDLRFKEGYNISIRQTARNNSLTFSSIQGAGAGVPCDEVKLTPGEVSPDGSGGLLTGGPACDEVIHSINGLTASVIRLVADLGTTITIDPEDTSVLIVDFDRNDMTVCDPVETIFEDLGDA
jgi:hypothetical protein